MSGLPYAPPLRDDEPLDGWLHRIASNLWSTRRRLLTAHGLNDERRNRPLRDYGEPELALLSELTDVPPDRLRAATLERWRTLGLTPDKNQRGHQGGAWATSSTNRYCPDCADEREGVHRIQWRVLWSFCCAKHRRLLAAYDAKGVAFGHPSPLTPAVRLAADHPALAVQRKIDQILGAPTAPVSYLGSEQSGWEYLSDLGTLTRIVANLPDLVDKRGHIAGLARRVPADWRTLADVLPTLPSSASPAVRLRHAAKSPAVIAVAATTAALALDSVEVAPDRRFWWMPPPSRRELLWHAAARGVSYSLWETLSQGSDLRAKSEVLKRFALTRRTQGGRLISPVEAAKLPAACWESVVPRDPRTGSAVEAVSASVALLIMATDIGATSALDALGLRHLRAHITRDWNDVFASSRTGDRNFRYLLELHEVLGAGHIPIDYARRRRTFPAPPNIGRNTIRGILRALDEPDAGFISSHIAWYLWELLTGGDFLTSERGHLLPGQHRRLYRNRRMRWATAQPKVLYETAELVLYKQNINEPVTWQPELRNGLWSLDGSDIRHLSVWEGTSRPLRARARAGTESLAYSVNDFVALAASGAGPSADRARRDLTRFQAIVECGTFKAAAAALGISSSALSGGTSTFERRLGEFVFDRSSSPVSLTPVGRRLQQLAVREGLSQDVLRRRPN